MLLVLGFATVLQIAGLPASALPPTSIDSVGMWDAILSGDPEGPRTALVRALHSRQSPGVRRRIGSLKAATLHASASAPKPAMP